MKKNDPYAALRYPAFRIFISTQFVFTIAILIQEISISYYLYLLTGDPLALGMVGIFEAIPYLILVLFGGYLADRYNKVWITRACFSLILLVSVFLVWATFDNGNSGMNKAHQPNAIYIAALLLGIARGLYNPSWNSLKPFLVKPEHYANSSTWSTQFWQSGVIIGPAIAGLLYAAIGLTHTLYLVLVLLLIALTLTFGIKSPSLGKISTEKPLKSVKNGLKYVYQSKVMFYAMILDMVSVLFGGVIAILPVFAEDILHVGAGGLGIMRSAPAVGAVLTILFTAYRTPVKRAWRNMLIAIAGFGLATLLFASSSNFYLSLFALFLTGAFDSISVVIRSTILQTLPAEHMRGRVSSVNGIFVKMSNELGGFESGLAAKLMGTVPSVFLGGSLTLLIAGLVYLKTKDLMPFNLLKYQSENQQDT